MDNMWGDTVMGKVLDWMKTVVLGAVLVGGTMIIQNNTHEVDGVIGDYYTQPNGTYLVACQLNEGNGESDIYEYYSKDKPKSDYITVIMEGNQIMNVRYR
jgi:hypothetical protein